MAEFANTPSPDIGPPEAESPLSEGATVELRLLVRADRGPEIAVEVQAPPDASVAAVGDALASAIGVEVGHLLLGRTGKLLDGHGELRRAGLREGDRLQIVQARETDEQRPRTAAPLELVVAGGPASGRRFPLAAGSHELGREPGCAIVLDDAALSARHLRLSVLEGGSATVTDLGSRNGSQLEGDALAPNEPRELPAGWVVAAGRTLLEVRVPRPEPAPPAAAFSDRSSRRSVRSRLPPSGRNAGGFRSPPR
jgi:hypothetical protein